MNEEYFLPIYDTNHIYLKDNVVNELELINVYIKYGASQALAEHISKVYTTNEKWLMNTREIILKINSIEEINVEEIKNILKESHYLETVAFKAKYMYQDLTKNAPENIQAMFDTCINFSSIYQQLQSNLIFANPFMIISPHILKFLYNIPSFSLTEMITLIGKEIMNLISNTEVSIAVKFMSVIAFIYTPIAIYFSLMCLFSWRKNLIHICNQFKCIKKYMEKTIKKLDYWINNVEFSYSPKYNEQITKTRKKFDECIQRCKKEPTDGECLAEFYRTRIDTELNEALFFSIQFNDYYKFLNNIKNQWINKTLNYTVFNNINENTMIDCEYPLIPKNVKSITNDVIINNEKTINITGKNSSGKTTLIKSFMINNITSQQINFGSFKTNTSIIYTQFFVYINIPDTSSKDSLFQAELRNCLNIINSTSINDKTLCIFDELLTGTNAADAERIQYSFIKYISLNPNIFAMITTHNHKVSKKLEKYNFVINKQMNSKTRKCIDGICFKNGALQIIQEMGFPENIINDFNN